MNYDQIFSVLLVEIYGSFWKNEVLSEEYTVNLSRALIYS
jgi:hypothetical protein